MNYNEFGAVIQEEVSFNFFLIYSSGGHFDRWSQTICGRGHYEKHLYEIILNLDQWLSRCRFKISDLPVYSSCIPVVCGISMIYFVALAAISEPLVQISYIEGIRRIISMKSF